MLSFIYRLVSDIKKKQFIGSFNLVRIYEITWLLIKNYFQGRGYYLGLCLPMSCSSDDVTNLVKLSMDSVEDASSDRNVTLHIVKDPHNYYYFTEDPTFWILL